MKKEERIIKKIKANKEISNAIENESFSDIEYFIRNAQRYIKAIDQGRVICSIDSVSASGMSRTIKFMECNGSVKNGFRYYNFFVLFKMLGYSAVRDSDYFRIYYQKKV